MVDFMLEVFIDNSLDKVVVEADAKVSVCGVNHARKWHLLKKSSNQTSLKQPNNSYWKWNLCSDIRFSINSSYVAPNKWTM